MTARLLSLWSRINASYWFYPAIFSILAFFLALGMVALDRNLSEDYFVGSDWLVPARPGGASDMLQVIAGSTIGVAATVFSITIVAVSYASGTYGPRLLTNFMEDKGNQLSLATFIGTFVYAVMVLRVVRREDESPAAALNGDALPGFVPQMSLLVAIALMLTSIGVLVFFLNHVPDSIRINTVLEDIGKRLIRQIQRRFPQEGDEVEDPDVDTEAEVRAERAGYIEIIDFDGLEDIAKEHDGRIVLFVEAGDRAIVDELALAVAQAGVGDPAGGEAFDAAGGDVGQERGAVGTGHLVFEQRRDVEQAGRLAVFSIGE